MALKDFTIVTNLLDGALQPLFVEAEHTAQISVVETKHALQLRVLHVSGEAVHIFGSDAHLFSSDHAVEHPANQVCPGIVALAYSWPKRLFGDDLRQDDPVARIRQSGTLSSKRGCVSGHHVTTT